MTEYSLGSTPQLKFHPKPENPDQELSFFDQKPRLLVVSLILLFFLAGAIRLYKIEAPGLVISREYRSAIYARTFYFEHLDSVEEWRKEIANVIKQNQPILEPPVAEFLVSLIYRVVGSEQLWFARLLTTSFWLVGGIFLYLAAKTLVPTDAAVFVTVYYLFVPLSILASRSFQPDSLMMMLFLISLFSIIRYYDKPSLSRLVTSAIISGLALLIRPLVLFTLFGAFTSLAVYHKGTWKRVIDWQFMIFMGIFLLPFILYYVYGLFVAGFLQNQAQMSFMPHLLWHQEYWKGWLQLGADAVGHTALLGALLGISMLRKGLPRALLIGLWVGYMTFGLVFNFHIHTHDYYHLQLIPIVALSFAPIVALITNHLRQLSNKWYWWLPVIGAILLMILFDIREFRGGLGQKIFENEGTAREIGEIVNHSSKTVYVARYYGMPLQYYGELAGSYWPRKITYWLYRRPGERELSVAERLNTLGFSPEYFIITNFNEFNRYHTDLKEFLANNCLLVAKSDKYLIYEACAKKP